MWVFDRTSQRFLLVVDAVDAEGKSYLYLAVSRGSGFANGFCGYKIDPNFHPGGTNTNYFADYPRIGTNASGVYVTADMRQSVTDETVKGANLFILEPTIKACQGGSYYPYFQLTTADGSPATVIQPTTAFDSSTTEYFVDYCCNNLGLDESVFLFRSATCCPGSLSGFTVQVNTQHQSLDAPDAPQAGSSTLIDVRDTRATQATYNNGRVWFAQTAQSVDDPTKSAVRVYSIVPILGAPNPVVVWEFHHPNAYFYNPSVTTNSNNVQTLVLNWSNPNFYPSIAFGTRAGLQWNGLASLKLGSGPHNQVGPANRWGDYAGAAPDPSGTGAWVYNELGKQNDFWGTFVAEIA